MHRQPVLLGVGLPRSTARSHPAFPFPGAATRNRTLPPLRVQAAVIGDTVGDPLKDTSGPSLNILIKLMAVESLVLAPFFLAHT